MDFSALTKKFKDATAPLAEKAAPFLDKAKDAGFKAIDFTQKQLQNTPIVLKTVNEYTDLLTKKRVVLIAYNETHPDAKEILLRSPIWSAKAWSDAAEVRFVEISKESEIASHLDIKTPVDMKVWYIGEETFHGTDVASIMKWWETRCYDGKPGEETAKEETKEAPKAEKMEAKTEETAPADPLSDK